jgi:hypothetical protein
VLIFSNIFKSLRIHGVTSSADRHLSGHATQPTPVMTPPRALLSKNYQHQSQHRRWRVVLTHPSKLYLGGEAKRDSRYLEMYHARSWTPSPKAADFALPQKARYQSQPSYQDPRDRGSSTYGARELWLSTPSSILRSDSEATHSLRFSDWKMTTTTAKK